MSIKVILKEKNLSIYELAKLSNVPYSTLNELVNGKKDINKLNASSLLSISKTLDMGMEDVLFSWNGKSLEFSLPQSLKYCFWDCKLSSLDLVDDSTFIIARVLYYGKLKGLGFVNKIYSEYFFKKAALEAVEINDVIASYLSYKGRVSKNKMKYYSRRDIKKYAFRNIG